MIKFPVAHFQKQGKWLVNGGTLLVTEKEFILKCFFVTVARFPQDSTYIEFLPRTDILYQRVKLRTPNLSYTLYFHPIQPMHLRIPPKKKTIESFYAYRFAFPCVEGKRHTIRLPR